MIIITACLMGRKNSSTLGGSLSRDGVSIKNISGCVT